MMRTSISALVLISVIGIALVCTGGGSASPMPGGGGGGASDPCAPCARWDRSTTAVTLGPPIFNVDSVEKCVAGCNRELTSRSSSSSQGTLGFVALFINQVDGSVACGCFDNSQKFGFVRADKIDYSISRIDNAGQCGCNSCGFPGEGQYQCGVLLTQNESVVSHFGLYDANTLQGITL